jgi:hypothetical protein
MVVARRVAARVAHTLLVFITVLVLLILDGYGETHRVVRILTPAIHGGRAPAAVSAPSDGEARGKPWGGPRRVVPGATWRRDSQPPVFEHRA